VIGENGCPSLVKNHISSIDAVDDSSRGQKHGLSLLLFITTYLPHIRYVIVYFVT
jgi:hypothetical protein